jgi:hypothetical protein
VVIHVGSVENTVEIGCKRKEMNKKYTIIVGRKKPEEQKISVRGEKNEMDIRVLISDNLKSKVWYRLFPDHSVTTVPRTSRNRYPAASAALIWSLMPDDAA